MMRTGDSLPKKIIKRLFLDDKGQAMVLVALSLVVLLGVGAITTDFGYLFVQRRQTQNFADAAALAGTWEITEGEEAVEDVVNIYAEEYGINSAEITSRILPNKTEVEVIINKNHNLFLARIININSMDVGARATATRNLIFGEEHKDLLPLGIVRYPDIFYRVDKTEVKNKDPYDDLFDKNSDHELYSRFEDSPGILNDLMIDFLVSYSDKNEKSTIWVRDLGNDMISSDEISGGSEYPSWEVEKELLLNIDVYKEAWEYLISNGATEYDIKFGAGNTVSGNFGLIALDGLESAGTSKLVDWIGDGYKDPLNSLKDGSGNVVPITEAILEYIEDRGDEAFIVTVLPGIKVGNNKSNLNVDLSNGDVEASNNEYLILRIADMKFTEMTNSKATLSGDVVEVFYNIDEILPGETDPELSTQSWLKRNEN